MRDAERALRASYHASRFTPDASLTPSLQKERALWESGQLRVVGVDEVGVGSLAGPVVAAAVLIPPDDRMIEGVRDSKVLSPLQRERLAAEIRRCALGIGLGAASVVEVEQLNVRKATHLAMRRALTRVGPYDHALIDGLRITGIDLGPHTAIVDGDATSYTIACASIVAKVARDRLMRLLAARYPGYGWEHNAGYGTPHHLQALRELGPTPFHRRTYAPVRAVLEWCSVSRHSSDSAGGGAIRAATVRERGLRSLTVAARITPPAPGAPQSTSPDYSPVLVQQAQAARLWPPVNNPG